MGMFYGGKVETMMPKLHSQNFEGMELIRPMYLIKEDDIIAWRDYNQSTSFSARADSQRTVYPVAAEEVPNVTR